MVMTLLTLIIAAALAITSSESISAFVVLTFLIFFSTGFSLMSFSISKMALRISQLEGEN